MDQYPDIPAEDFEQIERYLTGELDAAAKERFDARLANDPALRAGTDEVRLLIMGVRQQGVANLMDEFHKDMNARSVTGDPVSGNGINITQAVPRIRSMKRWLVAASVVAIVGVAAWFATYSSQQQNKLFQAYYEKDPGLLSAMGSVSDHYEFDRAMIDYKQGDNKAAIRTWEVQAVKQPANDTLNYFIASAYLADGHPEKAQPYFSRVISRKESAFLTEAYWYMALALISEGKEKEAVPYLQKSDRAERGELIEKINGR